MTKRKPKAVSKHTTSVQTTPRKGSKTKQRRVQSSEKTIGNDATEALKQKKLDFTLTNTPSEHHDAQQKPSFITPTIPVTTYASPTQPSNPSSPPTEPTLTLVDCRYKITLEMLLTGLLLWLQKDI